MAEINEGDPDHHPLDTWDPILPDPLIRSRTRVDQVDEEEESVGTTAEEATKVPTKQNQPTTVVLRRIPTQRSDGSLGIIR